MKRKQIDLANATFIHYILINSNTDLRILTLSNYNRQATKLIDSLAIVF